MTAAPVVAGDRGAVLPDLAGVPVLLATGAGLVPHRAPVGGAGSAYPDRWPLPRRFGTVALVSVLLALASTAAMAVLAIRSDVPFGADSSRVYFGTDTHAMGLLLGAAFGALAERLGLPGPRGGGGSGAGYRPDRAGRAGRDGRSAVPGRRVLADRCTAAGSSAVSALAVALVATVARPRQPARAAAGPRGRCAGSAIGRTRIYLWHWPVIVVTRPGVDLPDNRLAGACDPAAGAAAAGRRELRYLEVRAAGPHAGSRVPCRPATVAGRLAAAPRAGRLRRGWCGGEWSDLRPGCWSALLGCRTCRPVTASPGRSPRSRTAAGSHRVSAARSRGRNRCRSRIAARSGSDQCRGPHCGQRPAVGRVTAASPTAPAPARTAKAGTSAAAPEPAITAFGDSVMLGAQPAWPPAFRAVTCRRSKGRQPYVTLQDVRSRITMPAG